MILQYLYFSNLLIKTKRSIKFVCKLRNFFIDAILHCSNATRHNIPWKVSYLVRILTNFQRLPNLSLNEENSVLKVTLSPSAVDSQILKQHSHTFFIFVTWRWSMWGSMLSKFSCIFFDIRRNETTVVHWTAETATTTTMLSDNNFSCNIFYFSCYQNFFFCYYVVLVNSYFNRIFIFKYSILVLGLLSLISLLFFHVNTINQIKLKYICDFIFFMYTT